MLRTRSSLALSITFLAALAVGGCGDSGSAAPSTPDPVTSPTSTGGCTTTETTPTPQSTSGGGSIPPVSGNGAGDAPGSLESGSTPTDVGNQVPSGECSSVTTTTIGDSGVSNAPETSPPPPSSVAENGSGGASTGESNTG